MIDSVKSGRQIQQNEVLGLLLRPVATSTVLISLSPASRISGNVSF